ncbi:MAG: hypothetical protein E3J72_08175 [Planctomycetota bacterium]|nr:MAG: hypothetical protein E3J72_08175 [Planctomycetota bacterium]
MKYLKLAVLAFLIAGLFALPALPEDEPEKKPDDPGAGQGDPDAKSQSGLPAKIDAAIKKGAEWLKARQQADGSFTMEPAPFSCQGGYCFPSGATALCLFALLKCGVKPNDPSITKGFNYIRNFRSKWARSQKDNDAKYDTIYSCATIVLALEALHTVPLPIKKKGKKGEVKRDKWSTYSPPKEEKKAKMPRWNTPQGQADKKLIKEYIDWICNHREDDGRWRYPDGSPKGFGDLSNCQYAVLALNVARRLNIPHDKKIYQEISDYLLRNQEKDGPKVEPGFPVPVADNSIAALKKFQKDFIRGLTKLVKRARKAEKKGKDPLDDPANDPRTYVEEKAEKIYGKEGKAMKARGWCYQAEDTEPGRQWKRDINGGMTASATIFLVAAKDACETTGWWKSRGKKMNQAIRDGCAWIAHNFSVSGNPGASSHHYYWLYALERTGVICMVPKFSKHNWFEEGTKLIISQQGSDGSWRVARGTSGPNIDTCFALLFLKRATTPLVRLPDVTWTGRQFGK